PRGAVEGYPIYCAFVLLANRRRAEPPQPNSISTLPGGVRTNSHPSRQPAGSVGWHDWTRTSVHGRASGTSVGRTRSWAPGAASQSAITASPATDRSAPQARRGGPASPLTRTLTHCPVRRGTRRRSAELPSCPTAIVTGVGGVGWPAGV